MKRTTEDATKEYSTNEQYLLDSAKVLVNIVAILDRINTISDQLHTQTQESLDLIIKVEEELSKMKSLQVLAGFRYPLTVQGKQVNIYLMRTKENSLRFMVDGSLKTYEYSRVLHDDRMEPAIQQVAARNLVDMLTAMFGYLMNYQMSLQVTTSDIDIPPESKEPPKKKSWWRK